MSSTTTFNKLKKSVTGSSHFEAIEERDEIIKIATQKNHDKTLTLEESNRLFEQFNETLRAIEEQRKHVQEVDESWALELIKQAEEDEDIIVA